MDTMPSLETALNLPPGSFAEHLRQQDAKEQAPDPLDAASCSAFTVREALQRCANMDECWARSYRWDAKKCEESDHPKIRERAAGLISRAEEYELAAARYRSALEWMQS
jgi:uncharacterized protein involved in tolerance to divalent cations